mgnify:CR=1 FL=1
MTDFKKVTTKTKFSETAYYSVEKIVGDKIQLKNNNGDNIVVDKGYVEKCLVCADQFSKIKQITQTEIAQLFLSSPNVVFTVVFNKQVQEKDVVLELMEAYKNSTPGEIEKSFKKSVKNALQGVERQLIGYHSGNQDQFGRISCIDMEISVGHNVRLVDPRTISSLIILGTQYKVK